jgi:diaminopimelate epimerase
MTWAYHNRTIPFTKATACGNDFLIIEGSRLEDSPAMTDLSTLTRRMCDRHLGIGADGVEWLFPDAEADVHARLINADGSEAEISGNGTRCVASEICLRREQDESKDNVPKNKDGKVTVRTGAGLITCRLVASQGYTFEFEAEMGKPEVGTQLTIEALGLRATGTRVSMGNPHFVIFVDQFPEGWQQQAAVIGKQSQFPQRTNVEYVVVRGKHEIEIRLFERGVGETESSGTGSCASAVAAIAGGRVNSPVTVVAPGGPQIVRWEDEVFLTGPATLLCRGEFFI